METGKRYPKRAESTVPIIQAEPSSAVIAVDRVFDIERD